MRVSVVIVESVGYNGIVGGELSDKRFVGASVRPVMRYFQYVDMTFGGLIDKGCWSVARKEEVLLANGQFNND